jgi:hypothetical protein
MMPSRLAFGLWWAGWFKLAQRYPDQGSLGDVAWHPALFWLDLKAFGAVASANQHGLRVAMSLGPCAVFFRWPDVAISAKRGWLNTVIRIRLPAFPAITLAIEADDDDADDLLRPAGIVLAPRKCKWCHCVWVGIGLGVLLGAIIFVIALRP